MNSIDDFFLPAAMADEVSIFPIINMDGNPDISQVELPTDLPLLALRNAILFPHTLIPITVGREKSVKVIRDVFETTKLLGAVTQLDPDLDDPKSKDLFRYGCLAKILKIIEMPDGGLTAILHGYTRIEILQVVSEQPYFKAKVRYIKDKLTDSDSDMAAITGAIKDSALQILRLSPNMPQEAAFAIKNLEGVEFLINFIASNVEMEQLDEKLALLAEGNLKERGLKLLSLLNQQIEILKLKDDIRQKVRKEIDQQQREYYLNNQLKTIQDELGLTGTGQELEELRKRAKSKNWPKEVKETFEKDMTKLERTNPHAPDYSIQLNYLQYLIDLPWNDVTKDKLNLKRVRKVLNEDHYGLEQVKERILEYISVLKLKGDMKSPIVCLYGPPGVGKTSLGRSIARALGRNLGRISLGGLHDEAEIRGHRKTYIGAMPGRIIQTIKKCKSSNPLIILDEIDKVGNDFRGDPASALLEVLDPEQNVSFHDNYLDLDYDLSKVLFITTANNIGTIHSALRDRMELIPISGYLAIEKQHIAQDYLLPKQMEAHGLQPEQLKLSKQNIQLIINEYTRESGVRMLDKQLAKIARNTAKKIAFGEHYNITPNEQELRKILGLPLHKPDNLEGNDVPGVVTGLAWTENGGEVLFVESSLSQGKGVLTSTGNLGDVMKESAVIAQQYLKAHAKIINQEPAEMAKWDVHIHVPEGAIPKDGPSAGIAIVCAMASSFMQKPVRKKVAMTGEMTLRGKILPVGGIKEKILAAKRAGIKNIVLSAENQRDVEEVKPEYVKGLHFTYVKNIKEVLEFVLLGG
ncbi:MAG: endopeptidase La [Bacteroidales bacterium]|nr:endopeptidase La [Bacteroidales bacterium]